jgi:hypothetical protein
MTAENIVEKVEEVANYSKLTKKECLQAAEELVQHVDTNFALRSFKALRVRFEELLKEQREEQIKEFADAGNDVREFQAPHDDAKDEFHNSYIKLKDRKADELIKAEEEKKRNLKEKQNILDKLKGIVDSDETEKSLEEVRELQRQWKQIRQVPREHMNELWENYKVYLDKFYDNLSINRELKELDRGKNLEHKIELIKKVDALKEEKSARRALNYLHKYHDDFKNTGPVPKEHSEEIWQRFKAASDAIVEEKNKDLDALKEQRHENLRLKTLLCEKVEQMAEITHKSSKDWKKKTEEINAIFEEWKTIGRVPSANNDEIWDRFRSARNTFLSNKKKFFKSQSADREDNLKLKVQICEKAESIKDSKDFNKTADILKSLQAKWKEIGPVPEKDSDAVWKRFRAACDEFFMHRDITFKARKEEEAENLVKKKALLEKLEKIATIEKSDEAFAELKSLQKEWMSIGFVPFKNKKPIEGKFDKLADSIYSKFNKSRDKMNASQKAEQYEMMSSMPDGQHKLKNEERRVQDKLRKLKGEIETYENNIQFFSLSKGSEGFLKDIEKKINSARKGISNLEAELKLIRKHKGANAK